MPYDPAEITELCEKIRNAGGKLEVQNDGIVTGVEFSGDRVVPDDALLEEALGIPGLKKIRVGPGDYPRTALNKIAFQVDLEELWLEGTLTEDEDLRLYANSLPKLRRIRLRRLANVLDEGVIPLASLKELRILAIIEMRITGDSIEAISRMKSLSSLDLRDCYGLGIEDYAKLSAMPQLEELKLGGYGIGDGILERLGSFPKLNRLTLENAQVTPEGFVKFLETGDRARGMRGLELSKTPLIDDAALSNLKKCTNLRSLVIRDIPVSGIFLKELSSAGIPLETLFMDRTHINPEAFAALPKFSRLKKINLYEAYIDAGLIAIFSQIPELEVLELPQCRLEDGMLDSLVSCRNLRSIDIRGNPGLSEKGYKSLEKIPSLKEIKSDPPGTLLSLDGN